MGSQPAGPLANVWLSQFEPIIKDTAKIFKRYVDDIIRSIKKSQISAKLEEINNLHPNLKFTIEIEKDCRIAFLDLEIINTNGSLSSTWYRKPSDTGLVLNYHALAPVCYKRSVVAGFIHRIHRSCSTWENFHQSLVLAKETLEKNQYPPEFYDPIICDTINKIMSQKGTAHEPPSNEREAVATPKHLYRIQYRGRATDNYVKRLRAANAPIQPVITLRKLRSFLPSLKEAVPTALANFVVYQISCPSCSACYVGWTHRHLTIRFGEHRTRKAGPIAQHFMKCLKRTAAWDDIKILCKTTRGIPFLQTLEALYIRELKPSLNTRDEFTSRELLLKF